MNTPATHRVSMLEAMLLIRACEEALAARATPTSPGTCTSVGQEAAAVGVVRALEPRDRILTNHRSAGHLIARGADTGRLIAEVMGRVDGYDAFLPKPCDARLLGECVGRMIQTRRLRARAAS